MSVPAAAADRARDQRGADLRARLLRLLLVISLVAVLIYRAARRAPALCWVVVGCYLFWSLRIYASAPVIGPADSCGWRCSSTCGAGFADLDHRRARRRSSWTPYLIINGFFLIPVIAAAQLDPWACAVPCRPPSPSTCWSASRPVPPTPNRGRPLLRTVCSRPSVGVRPAVPAPALPGADDRRARGPSGRLLSEMITIEQREHSHLAESLHDGALQYVLGARKELEDVTGPVTDADATAAGARSTTPSPRPGGSCGRRCRSCIRRSSGGRAARRAAGRGGHHRGARPVRAPHADGWPDDLRTTVDELLLTTARELLGNVVKHARAATVLVELHPRRVGRARGRGRRDGHGRDRHGREAAGGPPGPGLPQDPDRGGGRTGQLPARPPARHPRAARGAAHPAIWLFPWASMYCNACWVAGLSCPVWVRCASRCRYWIAWMVWAFW